MAEIEDDYIGAAAADQLKKMGFDLVRPIVSRSRNLCTPGIDKSSRANNIVVAELIKS